MTVRIEPMAAEDWASVRRIYAEGIATGDATLEREAPDWDHFDRSHRPDCRLVARRAGSRCGRRDRRLDRAHRVLGTARVHGRRVGERLRGGGGARHRRRPRPARGTHPGVRGGRVLDAARRGHGRNAASLALHERVGFVRVGVQHRLGQDATAAGATSSCSSGGAPRSAPEHGVQPSERSPVGPPVIVGSPGHRGRATGGRGG